MGTTKLALYQRAILHCRATPITSLSEDVEVRRLCDLHYDAVLTHMMESGFWTHAMRSVEITENTGVTPAFGYTYAHDMPSDFIRLYTVSASEFYKPPLDYHTSGSAYLIEGGYIWANVTPLYMRYTSNDSSYGLDLTKWTDRLAEATSVELAYRICPKLTGSAELTGELDQKRRETLGKAQTLDSLQQPTQTGRAGSWMRSRHAGRYGPYRDE